MPLWKNGIRKHNVHPHVELERAHRITVLARTTTSSLRTFIVKFLNHQDKERIWKASRAKGQLIYKNSNIRFHGPISGSIQTTMRLL